MRKRGPQTKRFRWTPLMPTKKLHINAERAVKLEFALVTFLLANLDIFAWQMSDMPGIPREVIEHKLNIDPAFKPIKQKERRYTPKR
jgi:hypothetical protein